MNVRHVASALALVLLLSGCMAPMQKRVIEGGRADVDRAATTRATIANQSDNLFAVTEGVYLGDGEPIPLAIRDGREAILDRRIELDRGHLMTLPQIAELLRVTEGLEVVLTQDAMESVGRLPSDPFDADIAGGGTGMVPGAIRLSYAGSLKGFLDQLASRTGLWWEWREGKVVMARVQTRSYRIAAVPGQSSASGRQGASTSGGGAAGGGGGSQGPTGTSQASQETAYSGVIDVIGPTLSSITTMLSAEGKVALDEGLGVITVTDLPPVQYRVEEYVKTINAIATRQAVIDVQVVSVELTDGESYGLDWNVVREALNGRTRSGWQSYSDGPQNTNTAGFAVIDPTYNFAGSSVVLEALATQGVVKVVTNAAVVTMSNVPTPINVIDQTTYLASQKSNVIPETGLVQVELEAGTFTTGFSMQLLPVMLDNDEVLLQFATSQSSLRELRVVSADGSSDGARIESPNLATRDLQNRVRLRSGATLAMWGFDQTEERNDSRGIGKPDFMLAGGGTTSSESRTVLVVLVTPKVLD